MKTIIDQETGEVIDVETTNEVMVRELFELGTNLEIYDELEEQAEYIKEQIELWKFANRENIKNILKKHNKKSVETSYRKYTIVEEGVVKSVDTERLKEDGIYENYLKLSPRKEFLKVMRKKD